MESLKPAAPNAVWERKGTVMARIGERASQYRGFMLNLGRKKWAALGAGVLMCSTWAVVGSAGAQGADGCSPGTWQADYFSNASLSGAPKRTRCVTAVDFAWGEKGPRRLPRDNFSVRLTKHGSSPAGEHRFTTVS